VGKSLNAQLKIEGFNITNTPHFGQPGSNVSNLVLNAAEACEPMNGKIVNPAIASELAVWSNGMFPSDVSRTPLTCAEVTAPLATSIVTT
jgi:hypothetical protein